MIGTRILAFRKNVKGHISKKISRIFHTLYYVIIGCDPLTKYQAAQQYLQVTSKFEADHSQDYCGTAVIIAQSRKNSEIKADLKLTSDLQKEHPGFFLGKVTIDKFRVEVFLLEHN